MTTKAAPAQPLRPRHVPQRTCIACRSTLAKRELVRVVRTPAGTVEVDTSSKKAGRGAYLHRDAACVDQGLRKGKLARALKVTLSPTDLDSLQTLLTGEAIPSTVPSA